MSTYAIKIVGVGCEFLNILIIIVFQEISFESHENYSISRLKMMKCSHFLTRAVAGMFQKF